MAMKNKELETEVYIKDDLESIFVCAVRYSLGRRTYMPSIVAGYLKTQIPFMTDKTLKCILEDIDGCADLGDKCDCDTWHALATAIEAEIVKRATPIQEPEEKIEWCRPTLKDSVKEAICKSAYIATKLATDVKNDPVSHPSHYTDGKIEVIDFIEDKKLNFHLANAVKYIARAGKKCPEKEIEDLKKARWYLNRHIQNLEGINEK